MTPATRAPTKPVLIFAMMTELRKAAPLLPAERPENAVAAIDEASVGEIANAASWVNIAPIAAAPDEEEDKEAADEDAAQAGNNDGQHNR